MNLPSRVFSIGHCCRNGHAAQVDASISIRVVAVVASYALDVARVEGVADVLRAYGDGHDVEADMSKDALPTGGDDPPPDRRDDTVGGIEEPVSSGIDGVNHMRAQLLIQAMVKYSVAPLVVKG